MKPCPNPKCNSTDVEFSPFTTETKSGYVVCHDCGLFGPTENSETEAVAKWDNLPRIEAPLTLEVEDIQFHISFAVNGPITLCIVTHKDTVITEVPLTYSIGSAMCHAKDAFDFATSEKLAIRDACTNLDTWFFVSGQDLDHSRRIGRKLYSAYRKHLRERQDQIVAAMVMELAE